MSEKRRLRDFGPPEQWLIPTEDIKQIILTVPCSHGHPRIDACRECFVPALMERQLAILAERLGCTLEDATAVGEQLTRAFMERFA